MKLRTKNQLNNVLINLTFLLCFNVVYTQSINIDSLIYSNYISKYKGMHTCEIDTVLIPRFMNIDSNLYDVIEQSFLNKQFNSLYYLLAVISAHNEFYTEKFNNDFIINDGLVCQEKSIISLVRLAMKSNVFKISKGSEEVETTGDIMFWGNINKSKIYNYKQIKNLSLSIKNKAFADFIPPTTH
jgi:hypothetical protein